VRYYILDDDGNPLPIDSEDLSAVRWWAEWFENEEHRIVEQTPIGPYFVSTVFLGIDHNFSRSDHAPVLWETMVFAKDGQRRDLDCRRYASAEEAREGHRITCDLVRLEVEHVTDARRD